MAKINAAFSYGGVPLTVRAVEGLLGVRVDHVAVVSFSGFRGLTDALGGVAVQNPIAFTNLGHRFAKGQVQLDGAAALASVRARYPFADGDFQRVRNQQAYLRGLIGTLLSRGTLLDPGRLHSAVSAIAPYPLVDSGLNADYLTAQAVRLRGLRADDLVAFTIPTDGTPTVGDQSVVDLDDAGVADLAQHLRNDDMDAFQGCSLHVC